MRCGSLILIIMQSIKHRCGGFVTNLHLLKVIINVELLKGGHLLI